MSDEGGSFTVEKILAHISFRDAYQETVRRGHVSVKPNKDYNFENELSVREHCEYLYLTKWAGFSDEDDDTWEPERNFETDALCLKKYKERNNLPATHSTFTVDNADTIFAYPLTNEKWKKIPLPRRSTTPGPRIAELHKKRLYKKRGTSRDVTPASKNKKKRQIITSDDEDDVSEPPVKRRLLSEASVKYGVTSSPEISINRVVDHTSRGETSQTTEKVVQQSDISNRENKQSTDKQKASSSEQITDKTASNVNRKEKKKKSLLTDGSSSQKYRNRNVEVEKKDFTELNDQHAATRRLTSSELANNLSADRDHCEVTEGTMPVAGELPSIEDLFGENDESALELGDIQPSSETYPSSLVHSDILPSSTTDVPEKYLNVIRYTNQPRAYDRETLLRNVLSSRRCTSSEDLLKDCRNQYKIVKKQSRITRFFAGIFKKMQLCARVKKQDFSECVTVDMKIAADSMGSKIWKTKTKQMKKRLEGNSLPNKIPAVIYDGPELVVDKSEMDGNNKSIAQRHIPDVKQSSIKKKTLSGVPPIVVEAVYKFIKSMTSCAELSLLLKLVIAFLNTNSSQLAEILWKIGIQQRVILLKGLIENFMMYLHGNSLINFQPYQYLIMAETANSSFTVGSKVPECCGSGKYPHWKCDLLKVILRSCSEFSFGEDDGIFPSTSLVHCLQYGSLCLQCLFASVAPLGVGFADIGRFKFDSNILPLLRSYNEKNFVPLLLQNGFDPNGLITDSSEQAIFNISDVLQDLKIDEDKFNIMNEHSMVLLNYATKRLQSVLVNHGNLIIDDVLTLPHVVRSLGAKEGWIATYAEIYEDSETVAKRILTLHDRILDEDDLSSKNILFLLSLNPVNMVVSTTADCDLLLGEPSVPLIVTPAGSTRYKAREVMISISNQSRKRIRFHSLTRLSSGCDQYFIMDSKDKNLLKPGRIDIEICLEREDSSGILSETDDELQSFIVQLFVVSRKA